MQKKKKRQRAFVKIDPTLSSFHILKSQRIVEICSFTQQTLSTTMCQALLTEEHKNSEMAQEQCCLFVIL